MIANLPLIYPGKEIQRIIRFLETTFQKQKMNKTVIGLSGGIDSMVCFYLLRKILPEKNIIAVHLPYFSHSNNPKHTSEVYLKQYNNVILIKQSVNTIKKLLSINNQLSTINIIRIGNIMARVRMIILYDLAKKYNALVCGTENKSEHLLGYFTRFGDGASDVEPIRHLYKTQVYQLAEYLGVPKKIIIQKPTAGLWKNQTDEGQFGFTYKEADQVLHLYFDKKISTEDIMKMGYSNAKKIIKFAKKNEFKQKTPYLI